MEEIPILYSTPMIKAKLAGRKTQTRRAFSSKLIINEDPDRYKFHGFDHKGSALFEDLRPEITPWIEPIKCRYGRPGDIHYVRETHYYEKYFNGLTEGVFCRYRADFGDEPVSWNWRPNIFLHKEYCRIWDRVVSVRVERLQDISEDDAIAEGIEQGVNGGFKSYEIIHNGKYKGDRHPHAVIDNLFATISYKELWLSINGPGSWELNPWVWVITTETLSTTGKPELYADLPGNWLDTKNIGIVTKK